jgi:hypothetical protein
MPACFRALQITTRTCSLLQKYFVCSQPRPIQAAICHHGVSGVNADLENNVATVRMRDAVGQGRSQMLQIHQQVVQQ